jgi:cyclopropane fatty-acyl-phospholipid synthase-like methyltransferase
VDDHVRFSLTDYRDVTDHYDRIVSVGMFEHVGVPNFRTYFEKCHNILAEDGVMLMHTIGRVGPPTVTDDFTRKYIFPRRLYPGDERNRRGGGAQPPDDHRRGSAAPPLCAHAARVVRTLRGQPGQDRGAV